MKKSTYHILTHGKEKEKHTGEEALHSRDCKLLVVEKKTQLPRLVQLRVLRECVEIKCHTKLIKSARGENLKGELGLDILVKESKSQDGERGVAKVVH